LEIKNAAERDIELANRLRSYSRIFGLIPDEGVLKRIIEQTMVILGLFGFSIGPVLQWMHIDIGRGKTILSAVGAILLLLSTVNSLIEKIADFFEKRVLVNQKTALAFKREIKEYLLKRNKKILITVDDIDRLTPEEVRLVFKLIKINNDFPNVIYLLSFDRDVVQLALEQQPGISGQDYIEKIVQVSFDIPFAKQEKIARILFEELNRILAGLPKSSERLFDQTYWGNVYHSGLKNFFRNIRDVKRFASSLEFNFSLMFKGQSIEVNPIDFITIEAIRVFAPEFYTFMRARNSLFTSTERNRDNSQPSTRATEIKEGINKSPEYLRKDIEEISARLFPQVSGVFQYGYSSYGSDWFPKWNKNLRICSPQYFDAYFTFIPGGDESELSQYEIDLILSAINDQSDFEKILREFSEKGKIRKVLERLEDYTDDPSKMPESANLNVVQSLFNISDDLSADRQGMFDFGSDMQCARVIYQILKRIANKEDNFMVFREAIKNSKGLYGPVYNLSIESSKEEKEKDDSMLVPKDKLPELINMCLEKIVEHKNANRLKLNRNFLGILYRWKEWSKNDDWKKYVDEITSSDSGLINFLNIFVHEGFSQSMGDYVGRKIIKFNYESLEHFIPTNGVKDRLVNIKRSQVDLYQKNKDLINMFLDNFGKKTGPLE
jgi:predicted KAP-like P-loop ATPase